MQIFQHYDSLCWQIYNGNNDLFFSYWVGFYIKHQLINAFAGSVLTYNICHFLMTKNYSAQVTLVVSILVFTENNHTLLACQALEYLLWASFSIELSVPLMASNTLSWLVTLYCAVCQCYYDNQAAVQAEVGFISQLIIDQFLLQIVLYKLQCKGLIVFFSF